MKKRITEVRHWARCETDPWVVDILDNIARRGYVQPNGTAGRCFEYETEADAMVAETLYLAKNIGAHLGIETSTEKKKTCGDCVVQPRCGTILHEDSDSGLCLSFEAKSSAGEAFVNGAAGSKETNPKDVIGMKKAPISTLSCAVLFEMGLGMLEGARKYGRHNYRAMGVSATVYYDASIGHLMDWFEGEDIDPDSGLSHITKAMTALVVLRDSMLCGNWVDDRPLRNPNKLYKKSFNPKAKAIIEKYPDSVEPYLEINKDLKRGD